MIPELRKLVVLDGKLLQGRVDSCCCVNSDDEESVTWMMLSITKNDDRGIE